MYFFSFNTVYYFL